MDMIGFIGYFILNKKHKNGGNMDSVNEYYNSIIKFINEFKNRNYFLFFYADSLTYKYIKTIELWNKCFIFELNYEDLYFYKKFYNNIINLQYNHYNCTGLLYDNNDNFSYENIIKTLIIWHSKIELFILTNKIIIDKGLKLTHLLYLDSGVFRNDRYKFIKEFHENNFLLKTYNDININYTEEAINMKIEILPTSKLLTSGAYEVAAGHLLFNINVIKKIFDLYEFYFESLLSLNILTTEQRVFTLVFRKLYLINASLFTFKRNIFGCSYTIDLHN
jgi:hypothetical protein